MPRMLKIISLTILTAALAAAGPTPTFAKDCDGWGWHHHYPSSSYYLGHQRPAWHYDLGFSGGETPLPAHDRPRSPSEFAGYASTKAADLLIVNPLDIDVTYQIRSDHSPWYTHTRTTDSRRGLYTARPRLFVKIGDGPKEASFTLAGGRTYRFKRSADGSITLEDVGPIEQKPL